VDIYQYTNEIQICASIIYEFINFSNVAGNARLCDHFEKKVIYTYARHQKYASVIYQFINAIIFAGSRIACEHSVMVIYEF